MLNRIHPALTALALLLPAVFLPLQNTRAEPQERFDPVRAYAGEIIFDIYRKNQRIGVHTVTFEEEGNNLRVRSKSEISIRILGLPLYNFSYSSLETWQHGQLFSIEAETDDDGDKSMMRAQRHNGKLAVSSNTSQYLFPDAIYPTTHWVAGVIGSTQILNTITGQINTISMQDLGIEEVETDSGNRLARHYAYRGDLEANLWYNMKGHWVKMRFPGNDGVAIEYRCRKCGSVQHPGTSDANAGFAQPQDASS
jgi:hypothetical protein